MAVPNRTKVAADWSARGFSCDLWTDPPGQRWEDFRHATDELVTVLEGAMEFEVAGASPPPAGRRGAADPRRHHARGAQRRHDHRAVVIRVQAGLGRRGSAPVGRC